MTTTEFIGFPKIARLSREIIITEKIDGTNACILITEDNKILTGSRTRWITPEDDNYGFSKWVKDNENDILKLCPGRHFGEWWGSGINRNYGLPKGEKRFSLFNVSRWCLYNTEPLKIITQDPTIIKYQDVLPECVGLVPILYRGIFDTTKIDEVLNDLKINGSKASKGYMKPEGIVIFHVQGNVGFKKTIENDEQPKSNIKL
jgi:hypothetical protein